MLIKAVARKVFGTRSDREIKEILPLIHAINQREKEIRKLSDRQLQAKTPELKEKLSQGATLDDILVEAFAVCREAGARVLNMRHFDVQLIGAAGLHRGRIAEMKTGEGKTLVATLACYLNGLSGKGVHVITVNDYLARRDAEWMGRIHRFLGLQVGCITNGLTDEQRKKEYGSDITYGTNNEFGFDYLRDNMKPSLDHYVQRDPNFAIIDEVDSILIDEARTPLIISGPSDHRSDLYELSDKAVRSLKRDIDYTLDEKSRNATLTEEGIHKLEGILNISNLYDPDNLLLVHHVNAALRAQTIFKKDVDYVVRGNQIVIVDEFTGRLMAGRRWSDGLHQAIECKEGCKVQAENQTLATITLQNYFRLYPKLSGMTGTAATEAEEFRKIYGLEVLEIPTNKPMIRTDDNDLVYRNEAGKYRAIIEDIKEKYQEGRPVLVGTVSIAKSERIAKLLGRMGIPHNVLNAKNHEKEAEIIANAGAGNAVTIATNMAGRGTDIVLGSGVRESGGLHVIGTERHESRRIDNQLRGRAGRQGDPGSSQFYLSLEDDLMRIFASDFVVRIMDRIGMEEDVPISDKLITRTIEGAQKKVELHHFDQREHLLKYDDVLNKQREVIYSMRRLVLEGKETRALVEDLSQELVSDIVYQFCPVTAGANDWDLKGLREALFGTFAMDLSENFLKGMVDEITKANPSSKSTALIEPLTERARKLYKEKAERMGEEKMSDFERYFFIQSIDHHWKEHLLSLDHLKEGIHLRGYAQKDPLVEYRKEGFEMFKMLDKTIRQVALQRLFAFRLLSEQELAEQRRQDQAQEREMLGKMTLKGPSDPSEDGVAEEAAPKAQNGRPAPSQKGSGGAAPVNPGVNAALKFMKEYQKNRGPQK
jgi:preprotein translocase subunit SecA